MVFDFRLPDARLFDAMRVMGTHGGMLQVHCEDPRHARRRRQRRPSPW